MVQKVVQIFTLRDDATPQMKKIISQFTKMVNEMNKVDAAAGKLKTSTEKLTKAQQKEAEVEKARLDAAVIHTKRVNAATRAYERLVGQYDVTTRIQNKVKRAVQALAEAQEMGIITTEKQIQLERQVTAEINARMRVSQNLHNTQGMLNRIFNRGAFIMRTYIAGMALHLVNRFRSGLVDVALTMEKLNATIRASTGSVDAAAESIAFLRDMTAELGLEFTSVAKQYAKFVAAAQGTAIQDQVQGIFKGFSEASIALRLTAADTEGIFRALVQMMSKGTVQAEELRGQLGERLPGAIRLTADAMGVSTAQLGKMMEQGQLLAEDVLPKLSAELSKIYSSEALAAVDSMQGRINALKNAWVLFAQAINEAGVEALFLGILGAGTETMTFMGKLLDTMGKIKNSFMSIESPENLKLAMTFEEMARQVEKAEAEVNKLQDTFHNEMTFLDPVDMAAIGVRVETLQMWIARLKTAMVDVTTFGTSSDMSAFGGVASENTTKVMRLAAGGLKALEGELDSTTKAFAVWEKGLQAVLAYLREFPHDSERASKALEGVYLRYRQQSGELKAQAAAIRDVKKAEKERIDEQKRQTTVSNMLADSAFAAHQSMLEGEASFSSKREALIARHERKLQEVRVKAGRDAKAAGMDKMTATLFMLRKQLEVQFAHQQKLREYDERERLRIERKEITALRAFEVHQAKRRRVIQDYADDVARISDEVAANDFALLWAKKLFEATKAGKEAINEVTVAFKVADAERRAMLKAHQIGLPVTAISGYVKRAGEIAKVKEENKQLIVTERDLARETRDRLALEGRITRAAERSQKDRQEAIADYGAELKARGNAVEVSQRELDHQSALLEATRESEDAVRKVTLEYEKATAARKAANDAMELGFTNPAAIKRLVDQAVALVEMKELTRQQAAANRELGKSERGLAAEQRARAKEQAKLASELRKQVRFDVARDRVMRARADTILKKLQSPAEGREVELRQLREIQRLGEMVFGREQILNAQQFSEALQMINEKYALLMNTSDQLLVGTRRGLEDYRDEALNLFDGIRDAVADSFQGMEDALVDFALTGKLSFRDLVDSILAELTRLAVQKAFTGVLANLVAGMFSTGGQQNLDFGVGNQQSFQSAANSMNRGGGGFGTGGFNSLTQGTSFGAKGALITSPGMFANNLGVTALGEDGTEAVLPLSRTSGGRLGVDAPGAGKGSGSIEINVYNDAPGTTATAQSSPDGRRIAIYVKQLVNQGLVNGEFDRSLGGSFGLSRSGVR